LFQTDDETYNGALGASVENDHIISSL